GAGTGPHGVGGPRRYRGGGTRPYPGAGMRPYRVAGTDALRPARRYRKLFGQIRVRHMCAVGEPSKPRPSLGSLKLRPITSVNVSGSIDQPSWNAYRS